MDRRRFVSGPVCVACRLLFMAAVVSAGGCFSYHRGETSRLTTAHVPVPAENWPARDPEMVRALLEATPERLCEYRALEGYAEADLSPGWRASVGKPWATVVAKALYGAALVREFRREEQFTVGGVFRLFQPFEPNAYILTSRLLGTARARLAAEEARRLADSRDEVLRSHGVATDRTAAEILFDEGIAVRFPEGRSPARGILVHLWALMHNGYEAAVIAEFERRGWVVVEIDAVNAVRPDLTGAQAARILELEAERERIVAEFARASGSLFPLAGFDERLRASPDGPRFEAIDREMRELRSGRIALCSESDAEAGAALVARLLDDAGAENAYAVEAALQHLHATRPALRGLPVVVIGFSAGALSAPAAAARIRDDVDALVLVGGAANVAGVATRSGISNGGLEFRCGDRPAPRDLLRLLAQQYLDHSRLDPYHLGPALRGVPVLHVHAPGDKWVPSDLARLLNERLGGPDRLVTALGGHKVLFYFLPGQSRRIIDWVERAAGAAGTLTSGPAIAPPPRPRRAG